MLRPGTRSNPLEKKLKAAVRRVKALKKQLPAVLWSGTFHRRANEGLKHYSSLLCADFDHVGERVAALPAIARKDPHVVAAFLSPSGRGLKIVFLVTADASRHAEHFAAVRAHVASVYGAEIDEGCKDVARLCFVSHDPAAFYNPEAKSLMVEGPIGGLHQDHKVHQALAIQTTPPPIRLNSESCIATSLHVCIPTSLHNNTASILGNIKARAEANETLANKHPHLAVLYHQFIERRFEAVAHGRNDFIIRAVPFLYRAVAPQYVLELLGCFYDSNRALFNDPREQHMKQSKAMLEAVGKTYLAELSADERQIYDALPEREQDAFRICRDLALLPEPQREPLTFYLAFNHLAARLGIFPPQAQRIMRQFPSCGLIHQIKKGTRRTTGVRGDAGMYKWMLQPAKVNAEVLQAA